MEKWSEVFLGIIPKGIYSTQIGHGEEKGLVIELTNDSNHIILDFGIVRAIRILDEGIVQNDLYSDREIDKYKGDNFSNVIYEVHEGEFENQIKNIADGYWETIDAKHYVIITQNYNIDIITEYEPDIEVY